MDGQYKVYRCTDGDNTSFDGGMKSEKSKKDELAFKRRRTQSSTYFCNTFWASPVGFGDIREGGQQTVRVIVLITTVTLKKFVFVISTTTHAADKRIRLGR